MNASPTLQCAEIPADATPEELIAIGLRDNPAPLDVDRRGAEQNGFLATSRRAFSSPGSPPIQSASPQPSAVELIRQGLEQEAMQGRGTV